MLASTASLTAHLQRLASDHTSIPDEATEWVDYLVEGNDRSVTARTDGTAATSQAVDVHFGDLMADPWKTIAAVYSRLGIPLDARGLGTDAPLPRRQPGRQARRPRLHVLGDGPRCG